MQRQNNRKPIKIESKKKLLVKSVSKECEIDQLNDDCLIHIFDYLSIADKFRIERVCRKWQTLSKKSWVNFTRLDSSFKTWGIPKYPQNQSHTINSNIFDKVVNLCGKYLTSVNLSMSAFRKICKETRKIRELHLYDILPHIEISSSINEIQYEFAHWKNLKYHCYCNDNDWREIIQWLLSHSGKITKFNLNLCHNYYREQDLESLFKTMKNLKSFHLTDCNRMNFVGSCLYHLPFDTIEEICLENVQNIDNHLLSSVIKNCKNLRKICLYRLFGHGIDSIFEALVSLRKNLRNIDFRISGSFVREIENLPRFLSNMSQIKNLRKLDFINAREFVNDAFLEIVAKNCTQLIHLNIAGKNNVTDNGIRNICQLKNLIFLDIRDIARIKFPPLEKMQTLEILNCSNCTHLKEHHLCLFLQKASNLRAIDVRECPSVTMKLLFVACNVVKRRNSKKILEIYIERAKVSENFCYKKPNFLTLGIGSFEGERYGFENILKWEKIPQVRIQPNAVTRNYL